MLIAYVLIAVGVAARSWWTLEPTGVGRSSVFVHMTIGVFATGVLVVAALARRAVWKDTFILIATTWMSCVIAVLCAMIAYGRATS